MIETILYQQLKAIAIQLEAHRWQNSRGEHFQAAIILMPEQRPILTDLMRNLGYQLSTSKRTIVRIEKKRLPLQIFIHGHEEFTNVSLRTKRSFRSYIANLNEPNPQMLQLRRKRLELSRKGEISTSPTLLEHNLNEEIQRPFRDYILERITKNGDLEVAHRFTAKLRTADKCLITNFVTAGEVLWASLRRIGQKTQDLRLPEGVSVFISHQDRTRTLGKVAQILEKAQENGTLYNDWVLL